MDAQPMMVAVESTMLIKKVSVGEQDDCLVVGMAEDDDGDGSFLIIQSSLAEATQQEAAMGLDTYCLTDDSGGVVYGGVLSAALVQRTLVLGLTPETAAELSLPSGDVRLELDVSDAELAELCDGLSRVLSYGSSKQVPAYMDLKPE